MMTDGTLGTQGIQIKVLLVEDDPDDARMARLGLSGRPSIDLVHVRDGAEALEAIDAGGVALCLVDHRLPDISGVELVRRIRSAGFEGPVIMVSGVRQDHVVAAAFEAGADDFFVKDLDYGDELPERIEQHLGV